MSYLRAREDFEALKLKTNDPALREIAEGLLELTNAIEADFNKLDREVGSIKSKIKLR
jgi:hypothetical protein